MIKSYLAPVGYVENTIVIEHSKFIGYVCNAESEIEAKEFVEKIKKQNSLATHNCYAFITNLGQSVKFSDDGEPTGTAGMPILEAIKNNKLLNTVVVVTRYFGGIKLGVGGLVRAYTNCVVEAIQNSLIKEFVLCKEVNIIISYENFTAFQNYLNVNKIIVISTEYGENINCIIAVSVEIYEEKLKEITDYMQGKLQITEGKENFFPINN